MPKYTMWIPIHASAKFVLESKTPLTDAEVREKMLEEGEHEGSLCHQCSGDIETDWMPVDNYPCDTDDVHTESSEDDNDEEDGA